MNRIKRRPPKADVQAAVKVLQKEAESLRKAAAGCRALAGQPGTSTANSGLLTKTADQHDRKAARLSKVADWLAQPDGLAPAEPID